MEAKGMVGHWQELRNEFKEFRDRHLQEGKPLIQIVRTFAVNNGMKTKTVEQWAKDLAGTFETGEKPKNGTIVKCDYCGAYHMAILGYCPKQRRDEAQKLELEYDEKVKQFNEAQTVQVEAEKTAIQATKDKRINEIKRLIRNKKSKIESMERRKADYLAVDSELKYERMVENENDDLAQLEADLQREADGIIGSVQKDAPEIKGDLNG